MDKVKATPDQFMMQATFNYSDDSAQGLERRFNISEASTYDDFMKQCDKIWATIRFTFGAEKFDELTIPKKDVVEEVEAK